ncbi:MAG: transketolase family protein [Lachnospiraceae bacterium]|nr:transketolase family protein [Lachnospiraceae bacterium]
MAIVYDGSMDQAVYKIIFAQTIEALADADPDVVYLDADLMNSFGTHDFWKRNKKQAVNCGVAEANMMGVAAGLAAAGKKPYVHTFGPFATRRSYDQSFLSIAYAGNSVRIIGSDPGVTAAFNGGTHMPFEDVALMRAVPHSTVIDVSDGVQLEWVLKAIKDREGLTYLRVTRKHYPAVYSKDHGFALGKGEIVKKGTDVTVIASGLMVGEALKAATVLEAQGVSVRVVDMFTIKPIDTELVVDCAKSTKAIVTAENHNVIGGLGDAVADVLFENNCLIPMKKVGVKDVFGSVGPQEYLQVHYGLTADEIVKVVEEIL